MKLIWYDDSRFVPSVKNPSPDKTTVSSATVAGKFVQNAQSLKEAMEKYEHEYQHPAAIYWTESIQDASIYAKGDAVFELDVLFAPEGVPEGTEIVLALGDAAGKLQHSRYSAVLAKPGKNFGWRRLRFRLLGRPNSKVPDHEVRTLSFSFPPNVFDRYVWSWELWLDYLRTVARDPTRHRYPDPADLQFRLQTSSPPTAAPVVRMRDDFAEVHNTVNNWTWLRPYHMWRLVRPLCPVDTDDPCTTQTAYTGVQNSAATDGLVATLSYPAGRPDDEIGPKYSTLLLNDTELLLYGNWESRLKTPDAGPDEGIVSAFYTYFNDGREGDYNDDGLTDNHEIDYEFLNTDRGAIWCSVYTQKNACEDGDTGEFDNDCTEMDRVSARVDLRTGEIMATAPGPDQGTWDLTQQEGLQVTVPNFDHAAAFYTYGIEWREDRVTWWIEGLPGIGGRLQLWEVRSRRYGAHAIPSMPSKTMFNLWRTNKDWITQQNASNLSQDIVMEIDYVQVEELG